MQAVVRWVCTDHDLSDWDFSRFQSGGAFSACVITESDDHSAADALVGKGERPAVERIRTHLRTGWRNTVSS
ncbi:hypothetical protein EKL94_06460 [Stenotrophomonas maltophilia]|uniref:Uncharacterized protein n=1 Tax=Stenotrophomonas maltophilia TaxID=40324 RepID=A0A431UL55_STEMA|nr:hypothetical protein EKL94_06460 [Stenotrophomonas maltophilia]